MGDNESLVKEGKVRWNSSKATHLKLRNNIIECKDTDIKTDKQYLIQSNSIQNLWNWKTRWYLGL